MNDDTVSDLLAAKPGPHVVAVELDASVTYAVCLMNHNDVGAVLVMHGGQLAGILTERDVLRRVIEPGLDPRITRVDEVYTPKPRTIAADERAERAIDIMIDGKFRHLPVVEKAGARHPFDARSHGWRSPVAADASTGDARLSPALGTRRAARGGRRAEALRHRARVAHRGRRR